MSTTLAKRAYADALEDAEAFRALFPPACYARWEFGGSLRRRRPEVADVEHVIIPNFGDVERGDGLFTVTERVNLLFFHLDALVRGAVVTKHVYTCTRADGSTFVRQSWGDRARGVDFRGFTHELFTADADNWGCQLLIRTGPADFSERAVTKLKSGGIYRQEDRYVVHVASGERVPVRDEAAYFAMLGCGYIEPEKRR